LVGLVKLAKTVSLSEATRSLSRLVELAARGEEIVITKAGRPRARLVPMGPRTRPRKSGAWKGRIVIAADFDAPLPEGVLTTFRGAGR
jgi:prevent-host-death family protein